MKFLINFYFRHRKLCVFTGLVLAAAAVFAFPYAVHAAADAAAAAPGGGQPAEPLSDIYKDVNDIFNLVIRISAAWLWPVILMIGSLLDNDLIFGGAMGERLLAIWVQVRNLVNVMFVLVLLAIAVYNVLGLGEEGGGLPLALKTAIPKFVLALIAVNFSFVAARVVLDFTNVITGAVFALPSTVLVENGKEVKIADKVDEIICGTPSQEVPMRATWCKDGKINERAQAFFSRLDRSNITIAYAIRFGRAPQLKFIRDGLKGLGQLGFNIIFNAVLYVVYAVSFIVLFLVLLLRIVMLWVGVVLSPIIALGIVLPQLGKLAGEGGGLQEKFIANAIAPIKIGLVLSIGYIMLDGFEADKSIHGSQLSSNALDAIDPNSLPTDITDLQQLMIAIAVVVIVWMGVFEGTKGTAAEGITGWIKGHMEGFGKWAAKLPTYAQVLPVGPGMGGRGIAQALDTIGFYKDKIDTTYGRSNLRGGDTDARLTAWEKAAESKDKTKFAGAFAYDPGVLGQQRALDALRKIAEHNKDGNLIDQLKGAENENALQRLERIWNSNGPVATAIKAAAKKGDLETRIRTGAPGAQADSKEAPPQAPAAIKDKAGVMSALTSDRKAEDLAKEPVFAGWNNSSIDQLKGIRQELREAVIVMDTTGNKVDMAQTLSKMTAAKQLADALTANKNVATATPAVMKAITDAQAQNIPTAAIKQAIKGIVTDVGVQEAFLDAIPGAGDGTKTP
ncbi:MAG: hypothetical protein AAB588_02485 [Patescibacteria group bacterium]